MSQDIMICYILSPNISSKKNSLTKKNFPKICVKLFLFVYKNYLEVHNIVTTFISIEDV